MSITLCMGAVEGPDPGLSKRVRWFLRSMASLASWMALLSRVLRDPTGTNATAGECLQVIEQEERRTRLLANSPSVKSVGKGRGVGGSLDRRQRGEWVVIDEIRKAGVYESRLGSWRSICDAALDLSARILLAMPWDPAMDTLTEDAFLLDPSMPRDEMWQARKWAIRKSILGNRAVGALIAQTQNDVHALLRAGGGKQHASVAASSPDPCVFTDLPPEEFQKIYTWSPTLGDVQIIPAECGSSISTHCEEGGVKGLWKNLSMAWLKTPGRSFSSAEAAGVSSGQGVSGGRRKNLEYLRSMAVNGKPIVIKAKFGGAPYAYYLMTVLKIVTAVGKDGDPV